MAKITEIFERIAKANNAIEIRIYSQASLYRVSVMTRFSSLFKTPKLSYGACLGLTLEWYRHFSESRNFYGSWESIDTDFINRVNAVQKEANEGLTRQLLQRKGVVNFANMCRFNTLDPYKLFKLYGLDSHFSQTQWNYKSHIDDKVIMAFGSQKATEDHQNVIETDKINSVTYFDKFYSTILDELSPGDFGLITTFIITQPSVKDLAGHSVGISYQELEESVVRYHIYEPNAGEAVFTRLEDLKNFISEYNTCLFQYKNSLAIGMYGYSYKNKFRNIADYAVRIEPPRP